MVTGEPSVSEMLSLEGDQGWLRLNSRLDGLVSGLMSRLNMWSSQRQCKHNSTRLLKGTMMVTFEISEQWLN